MLGERPEELNLGVVGEVAPLLLAGILEDFVLGGGGDDVDPAAETVLLAGLILVWSCEEEEGMSGHHRRD